MPRVERDEHALVCGSAAVWGSLRLPLAAARGPIRASFLAIAKESRLAHVLAAVDHVHPVFVFGGHDDPENDVDEQQHAS